MVCFCNGRGAQYMACFCMGRVSVNMVFDVAFLLSSASLYTTFLKNLWYAWLPLHLSNVFILVAEDDQACSL